MVQPRMNTELLPIIDHLQAMVATLEGLTTILRKMAARPWPESPDGEGIVGDALNCKRYTPTLTDPRD